MGCALLSPHLNLPAGAGEGWASPEPQFGAGSRPSKEPLWLPGAREGRREGGCSAGSDSRAGAEPGTPLLLTPALFLSPKGILTAAPNPWSALPCVCSLWVEIAALCTHPGGNCASTSPCVAFFPLSFFFPSAALSWECWSCCTQGF